MWDDVLSEGLIASFPKETVVEFLKKEGAVETLIRDDVDQKPGSWQIRAAFRLKGDGKQMVKDMNEKLFVYGYFVAKSRVKGPYWIIFSIEPKFPEKYEPREGEEFVHVTSNSFVEKIKKIGLAPKETATDFSHPGNRVYLFTAKDPKWTRQLALTLASNKKQLLKYPTKFTSARWTYEDLVVVGVDVDGLDLFEDPSFMGGGIDYRAVFTKSNIGPKRIKFIDSVDDYMTKTKLK